MQVVWGSSVPLDAPPHCGGPQRWIFKESAERFHLPLQANYNTGVEFTHESRNIWPLMLDRLRAMPRDEVALTTDTWDVFFCAGPEEIEAKFRAFGKGVLFCMETNPFPPENARWGEYPPGPTRWRYINGGQIMGYAGALLDLFEHPDFWDWNVIKYNQEAYNRWWMLHPDCPDFALDFYCQVFCCIYDSGLKPSIAETLEVRLDPAAKYRRIYNRETGSYPATIHGNGQFSVQAARMWEQLR